MKKIVKVILVVGILFTFIACDVKNSKESATYKYIPDKEITETTTINTEEQPATSEIETTGNVTPTDTGNEPEEMLGYAASETRTYADEDMKRLGVDKKLAVICDWRTAALPEEITSKFNELLVNKYGCDFVVEFIGFKCAADLRYEYGYKYGYKYGYGKVLSEIKELGQQADIIVSGSDMSSNYTTLVNEGFLVELTDILKDTEDGKKIYEAYPENMWGYVKRDDEIYGICSTMSVYSKQIMVCNKEYAESLGLEVKEGFSFEDIGTMLEGVSDELTKQDLIGLYVRTPEFDVRLGYDRITDKFEKCHGIYAKQKENGEWIAFNPLLDESFINLCHTIREYKEKGWLVMSAHEKSKATSQKIEDGKFLFYIDRMYDGWNVKQIAGNKIYTDETGTTEVIVGEIKNVYLNQQEAGVTGIASWSQYKEEALKLLRIFQTEEEVVKLLAYGIEDEHYIYANREVIPRVTNIYKDAMRLQYADVLNPFLAYPTHLEPDNKKEFYEEIIGSGEEGALLKYGITYEEHASVVAGYDALSEIYNNYCIGLLCGNFEDVEKTISETLKLQNEAGINELIYKFNERFESGVKVNE